MRYTVGFGDGVKGDVPLVGRVVGDLLEALDSGAKKALRLCVEGRSEISGTYPRLLAPGAEFTLEGVRHHPSALILQSPRLGDVLEPRFMAEAPENGSAIGLFAEGMRAAIEHQSESDLVDVSMIHSFEQVGKLLDRVGAISITNGAVGAVPVVLKPSTLQRIREFEIQEPVSRTVRVSGTLDIIQASDNGFTLDLASGRKLRGVYAGERDANLDHFFGKVVAVTGTVRFRSSGRFASMEAVRIDAVTPEQAELWASDPVPFEGTGSDRVRRKMQGTRSGVNAVFGKWPIDVTDEEFLRLTGDYSDDR